MFRHTSIQNHTRHPLPAGTASVIKPSSQWWTISFKTHEESRDKALGTKQNSWLPFPHLPEDGSTRELKHWTWELQKAPQYHRVKGWQARHSHTSLTPPLRIKSTSQHPAPTCSELLTPHCQPGHGMPCTVEVTTDWLPQNTQSRILPCLLMWAKCPNMYKTESATHKRDRHCLC